MEYRPGCTPVQAVVCLKMALKAVERAEHCAVLWFAEIRRRRIFRQQGYSSMNQFAERELGFSRTRTGDYLRLAAKLDELPALRDSMAAGKVGYSKAREVIKVATSQTEDHWVEMAATHSRASLRAKVRQMQEKAHRRRGLGGLARGPEQVGRPLGGAPGCRKDGQGPEPNGPVEEIVRTGQPEGRATFPAAVVQPELPVLAGGESHLSQVELAEIPVRLGVEMGPEQFARFEALMGRLQRLGRSTSGSGRAQVLLDGLAALVAAIEGEDEAGAMAAAGTSTSANNCEKIIYKTSARRRAPVQIHVYQCPDCGQASVRTSRGVLPISPTTFERLACDAIIHRPGGTPTGTDGEAASSSGMASQAGRASQVGQPSQAGQANPDYS